MSVATQAWIWQHGEVRGIDKLVMLALAECGSYGDDPWLVLLPPREALLEHLADLCGISEGALRGSLSALTDTEEIAFEVYDTYTVCTILRMARP